MSGNRRFTKETKLSYLKRLAKDHDGNLHAASRKLGVDRKSLREWKKELGPEAEAIDQVSLFDLVDPPNSTNSCHQSIPTATSSGTGSKAPTPAAGSKARSRVKSGRVSGIKKASNTKSPKTPKTRIQAPNKGSVKANNTSSSRKKIAKKTKKRSEVRHDTDYATDASHELNGPPSADMGPSDYVPFTVFKSEPVDGQGTSSGAASHRTSASRRLGRSGPKKRGSIKTGKRHSEEGPDIRMVSPARKRRPESGQEGEPGQDGYRGASGSFWRTSEERALATTPPPWLAALPDTDNDGDPEERCRDLAFGQKKIQGKKKVTSPIAKSPRRKGNLEVGISNAKTSSEAASPKSTNGVADIRGTPERSPLRTSTSNAPNCAPVENEKLVNVFEQLGIGQPAGGEPEPEASPGESPESLDMDSDPSPNLAPCESTVIPLLDEETVVRLSDGGQTPEAEPETRVPSDQIPVLHEFDTPNKTNTESQEDISDSSSSVMQAVSPPVEGSFGHDSLTDGIDQGDSSTLPLPLTAVGARSPAEVRSQMMPESHEAEFDARPSPVAQFENVNFLQESSEAEATEVNAQFVPEAIGADVDANHSSKLYAKDLPQGLSEREIPQKQESTDISSTLQRLAGNDVELSPAGEPVASSAFDLFAGDAGTPDSASPNAAPAHVSEVTMREPADSCAIEPFAGDVSTSDSASRNKAPAHVSEVTTRDSTELLVPTDHAPQAQGPGEEPAAMASGMEEPVHVSELTTCDSTELLVPIPTDPTPQAQGPGEEPAVMASGMEEPVYAGSRLVPAPANRNRERFRILCSSSIKDTYMMAQLELLLQTSGHNVSLTSTFAYGVTHFVVKRADSGGQRPYANRTMKYLQCLAVGVPVISLDWVEACLDQDTVLPWNDFEVFGDIETQRSHVFTMSASALARQEEQKGRLLPDLTVYVHVCGPGGEVTREQVQDLVVLSGGRVVNCLRDLVPYAEQSCPTQILVIGDEQGGDVAFYDEMGLSTGSIPTKVDYLLDCISLGYRLDHTPHLLCSPHLLEPA